MSVTTITHQPFSISGPFDAADLAGSTVTAANIPAGAMVPAYGVNVIVTEAITGESPPGLDIGDSDGTDGWFTISALSVDTGLASPSSFAGTQLDDGKYYPAGDVLNVTVDANCDADHPLSIRLVWRDGDIDPAASSVQLVRSPAMAAD